MALDPITAIAEGGGKLLDIIKRFIPDQEKAQEAAREVVGYAQSLALAQIELNKEEAKHQSIFVAGGRPFIIWVCGVALATYYIPRILITDAMWIWACLQARSLVPYPEMSLESIMTLLGGILGLGAMRTVEKVMGTKQ